MEELLAQFQQFAQANIIYAPWAIFGVLLLAGLNVPVSEDAMIFISAILAANNPEYLWPLFFAVYLGAYGSDLICFFLGRFLGKKILTHKFFSNMISQEKLTKMNSFYNQYGVWTLIFGRFVPFGVRNLLFLTAGIGKMRITRFALSDLLAVTISSVLFFYLYYTYGNTVLEYVKQGNKVVFGSAAVIIIGILIFKKVKANQVGPSRKTPQ